MFEPPQGHGLVPNPGRGLKFYASDFGDCLYDFV